MSAHEVTPDGELSPAGARRLRKTLDLAPDATDLEVLAAVAELQADGFVVVRRSELDAMHATVAEANETAESALRLSQQIEKQRGFAALFSRACRLALVDERDHEPLAAMFAADPEGARLILTTNWKEAL